MVENFAERYCHLPRSKESFEVTEFNEQNIVLAIQYERFASFVLLMSNFVGLLYYCGWKKF